MKDIEHKEVRKVTVMRVNVSPGHLLSRSNGHG
jgi:hypothetical protein